MRRAAARGSWGLLPALAFVGLADVAANGTYSVAAQSGPVTVAAVLSSLYPVVTALAAFAVLKERLRTVQAMRQPASPSRAPSCSPPVRPGPG